MTITTTDAERRVAAGAALLDTARPGWPALVDLNVLDIADWRSCILGQLYGRYTGAARVLFDRTDIIDSAVAHGFDTGRFSAPEDETETSALTAAWRKLILERRRG
jgi:hypothetical protein